ncbi:astacin (Peptidase family m12A) domain-containing protein [Ditylenchus destructor]|uniref:Metalloendopeptidase n=1 Tax=Ditylenchus destructor TaxID=166010 RepID=A0AAD4N6W6_9BILA|nr:astacin (Peptidase family m12A) domain-containing protein [Ditylenchus destructor]
MANEAPEGEFWDRDEPLWMHSGKFQGDIDGVDEDMIQQDSNVQFNALRNKQLTWPNGIVPYELDEAFSNPRKSEDDFLNIVKGHGCYSQVGRTGGKQEISLGRGCLFNETIIHELMHSLGFWHEHSRADRDDNIIIRWENILPGMDSQFDIVSSAIQDNLGEDYDYRSIMHYGSTAFSRNGRNTIEAVIDGFSEIIGTATDLSDLDVIKISKLYRCEKRQPRPFTTTTKRNQVRFKTNTETSILSSTTSTTTISTTTQRSSTVIFPLHKRLTTEKTTIFTRPTTESSSLENAESHVECKDHFVDCPMFKDYCAKVSFFFIMKSYCPVTCGQCSADDEISNEYTTPESSTEA